MLSQTTTRRFTLDEYHRLIELGFFHEDERVELIRGELVQMVAKGTAHTTCCSNLIRELAQLVAGKAELRCQDPITLPSDSEPEPDFAIVRSTPDNYLSAHPTPADIFLVIEIADSSLDYDRDVKMPLYAEAEISHYWIFNVVTNQLEAYSEPYKDSQNNFGYRFKRIFLANQSVELSIASPPLLDLSAVFPHKIS
ncbi:Uma2 family endonuclease [Fischerella sp. JS2]|uniref:Uma2 family endonuclease n=1 Tax=Fischerella sp. JS2 TaxID=2597771 RepID=UPI0028E8084A|nr:Uma2 family endonuclease [Fischerella sp. JS2]